MPPAGDEHVLRVFEISVDHGDGIEVLAVDLPAAWARAHTRVDVSLTHAGDELGWHAHLVGDDDEHVLGFPWYDHVETMLLARRGGELPMDLAGPWDDLEQGWWASAIPAGSQVYLAETDFDELVDKARKPSNISRNGPGIVSVDGVEVRWNSVPRVAYDEAWKRAIVRFRGTD